MTTWDTFRYRSLADTKIRLRRVQRYAAALESDLDSGKLTPYAQKMTQLHLDKVLSVIKSFEDQMHILVGPKPK
jgi:hypothetical protein